MGGRWQAVVPEAVTGVTVRLWPLSVPGGCGGCSRLGPPTVTVARNHSVTRLGSVGSCRLHTHTHSHAAVPPPVVWGPEWAGRDQSSGRAFRTCSAAARCIAGAGEPVTNCTVGRRARVLGDLKQMERNSLQAGTVGQRGGCRSQARKGCIDMEMGCQLLPIICRRKAEVGRASPRARL